MRHKPTLITLLSTEQSNPVITLADFKTAAKVTSDDEDSFLNLCMSNAKSWVEGYTNRSLDDCTYKCVYEFKQVPRPDDQIWLSVGPVNRVTKDAVVVAHENYSSGVNSFIKFQDGWDVLTITLEIRVQWGTLLAKIAPAVMSVAVDNYHYPEGSRIQNVQVNKMLVKTLNRYRRV